MAAPYSNFNGRICRLRNYKASVFCCFRIPAWLEAGILFIIHSAMKPNAIINILLTFGLLLFFSFTDPTTAGLWVYILFFLCFGCWVGSGLVILSRIYRGYISARQMFGIFIAGSLVAMVMLILVWYRALTMISGISLVLVVIVVVWYVQKYKKIK